MAIFSQKLQHSCSGPQWHQIGVFPHVGINLPLSALHSKHSCGIGEFLDLLPLLEWCSLLKMDVIQLLPLNDSALDPSPYNALSSCALHPIYLSLLSLPYLEDKLLIQDIKQLTLLSRSKRIRWSKVLHAKMDILLRYFEIYGTTLIASSGYNSFLQENPWVKPYALFKALKYKSNNAPFSIWQDSWKTLSPSSFISLENENSKECSFYTCLQYLCFLQLKAVKQKAQEKKILLKGDIPILISADSADVWFQPELFNLKLAAGAPPDQYSKEGQYWGFPIFNWDAMRKDHFLWWKTRLHYASSFYDLYRIDHAVGLFRLWAIPLNHPSKEGHFIPSEESLWEPLGRELLQMLTTSSSMLPIAEDLGTVPLIVRPILEELGICGTKVMRWERNWHTDHKFIDPKNYSPISLTCVSTHDSTSLEGWWQESPEEALIYASQKGWDYTPLLTPAQRRSILKESVFSQSLFHINLLSEYLALVPEFVWKTHKDERINIPGTISPFNWTYRFRRSLEEMTQSSLLKQEIESILKKD